MASVPTIPQVGSSGTDLSWLDELGDWVQVVTGSAASGGALAELGVQQQIDSNAGTQDASDQALTAVDNVGSTVSSGVSAIGGFFSGLENIASSFGSNPLLWVVLIIVGLFVVLLLLGKVETL
jgi:hypothetical protein